MEDFSLDGELVKLGDLFKIYDGTHNTPNYVEKGIPFLSVESINTKINDIKKFISKKVYLEEIKRVNPSINDVLMTRIGDIGTPRVVDFDEDFSFYVTLALFKQNERVEPSFLKYTIESQNMQKQIWSKTLHVAFPNKINLGEISNLEMIVPEIEIQQQVSAILSSMDEFWRKYV